MAGSSEGEAMPDLHGGVHPSSHTNLSWPTSLVTRKVILTDSLSRPLTMISLTLWRRGKECDEMDCFVLMFV